MKKTDVRSLCYIAVFAGVISIVSQFSIPLPGGVPMTLQTFILPVAGVILGSASGFWSAFVYVLIGAVGMPVFAGWTGGLGIIAGMTGGFIVSFPLLAMFAGLGDELGVRFGSARAKTASAKHISYYVILALFLLIGNVINYGIGAVWFKVAAGTSFGAALTACVTPFIPTTILKNVLVMIVAPVLKHTLTRSGVLEIRKAAFS